MNTVLVWYGHSVRTKQYTKKTERKITPNSICLWRQREHGDSNKRWRQKQFEPSQEMDVKKVIKWQCVVGIYFIMICECVRSCKFYPKLRLASAFTLTKSTRTLQEEILITSKFHFENIRKITKNNNFKGHFLEKGWSYRLESLHDILEDQAQWHISKLCSFF